MPKRRLTPAQRKRHEEAADWLLRNGEAAQVAPERSAFEAWLNRDPENRQAYDAAQRLMGEASIAIQSDPSLREHETRSRGIARPAAGVLLALALACGAFLLADGPMRLEADARSGAGEMPVLTLEDGSIVQMNASSAIAYDYSAKRRSVRLLRGQAFFQVAPDPARPFTVEAGEARITALGTAFDVRRGSDETDVTVTHNAVLIAFADPNIPPARVSEGEVAAYAHGSGVNKVAPGDVSAALAWTRGQLVLDNQSLSFVVEEINRHFPGRIMLASSALAERRVSGTIAVADTNAALTFLEQALGVSTSRIGPLIVVWN